MATIPATTRFKSHTTLNMWLVVYLDVHLKRLSKLLPENFPRRSLLFFFALRSAHYSIIGVRDGLHSLANVRYVEDESWLSQCVLLIPGPNKATRGGIINSPAEKFGSAIV